VEIEIGDIVSPYERANVERLRGGDARFLEVLVGHDDVDANSGERQKDAGRCLGLFRRRFSPRRVYAAWLVEYGIYLSAQFQVGLKEGLTLAARELTKL